MQHSRLITRGLLGLAALMTLAALVRGGAISRDAPVAHGATTFDAAADFSPTANPNGVWSYGWSVNRGAPFNLATNKFTLGGLDGWDSGSNLATPGVLHNGTAGPVTLFGTLTVPVGGLLMHPGPNGENALVRWTAPASGTYQISGAFIGIDFAYPTTTDFAILHSSTQLFTGDISSYNVPVPFSFTESVAGGETIDFTVGFGVDGTYWGDSTALDVTISPAGPSDSDGDRVPDASDNCPSVPNGPSEAGIPGVGNQTDTDGDGQGDACDPVFEFSAPFASSQMTSHHDPPERNVALATCNGLSGIRNEQQDLSTGRLGYTIFAWGGLCGFFNSFVPERFNPPTEEAFVQSLLGIDFTAPSTGTYRIRAEIEFNGEGHAKAGAGAVDILEELLPGPLGKAVGLANPARLFPKVVRAQDTVVLRIGPAETRNEAGFIDVAADTVLLDTLDVSFSGTAVVEGTVWLVAGDTIAIKAGLETDIDAWGNASAVVKPLDSKLKQIVVEKE